MHLVDQVSLTCLVAMLKQRHEQLLLVLFTMRQLSSLLLLLPLPLLHAH